DKYGLADLDSPEDAFRDANGGGGEDVGRIGRRVEKVGSVFKDEVRGLLGVLGKQRDENLRGLSVRLDFNHVSCEICVWVGCLWRVVSDKGFFDIQYYARQGVEARS
ncbi:hypothetical protein HK097_005274, partial [Rhizophlyctis rosea]